MISDKPKDLTSWAYETIKNLIINNKFKNGEKLKIDELSGELAISRTPIREALLRLQSEGFVKAESRVGFFVKGITKEDFDELFEIRELLEVFAVKKAAKHISDEDMKKLEEIDERSRELIEAKEMGNFLDYEITIHSLIIKSAKNKNLSGFLESINDLIFREKILSVNFYENVCQSVDEHHEIIEALKSRNALNAGKAMERHISNVKNRLEQFFNFDPTDNAAG